MPATAQARKVSAKNLPKAVVAGEVIRELEKHILVDGFKLVFDLEKSRGSRFVDAATGRELIDLYSFYASQPIGFNHPYFEQPEVQADLLAAAKVKVANADVYTVQYATFVKTFARVMGLPPLERYLLYRRRRCWPWRTRSKPPWIGKCGKISPRARANAARKSFISKRRFTVAPATR